MPSASKQENKEEVKGAVDKAIQAIVADPDSMVYQNADAINTLANEQWKQGVTVGVIENEIVEVKEDLKEAKEEVNGAAKTESHSLLLSLMRNMAKA